MALIFLTPPLKNKLTVCQLIMLTVATNSGTNNEEELQLRDNDKELTHKQIVHKRRGITLFSKEKRSGNLKGGDFFTLNMQQYYIGKFILY
jgi:hypothetical protein